MALDCACAPSLRVAIPEANFQSGAPSSIRSLIPHVLIINNVLSAFGVVFVRLARATGTRAPMLMRLLSRKTTSKPSTMMEGPSSGCTDSVLTDPDRSEPISQPATPQHPPSALCLQLSHCIDAFHTELLEDARLATISHSLDLMRLQMLIIGLASGTNTACGALEVNANRLLSHNRHRPLPMLRGTTATQAHGHHCGAH